MGEMTDIEGNTAAAPGALTVSVFGRYGRELHRYLARRLRRPADADDLAQEVYLRLLRRNRDEAVANPRAYVYRIASHVVSEFQSRTAHGEDHVTFSSEAVEHLDRHPPEVASEDELAERLHLQREIQQALSQLPPTHQAIFLLHKRDGHSHEEIARKLEVSMHTVEKYLVQAKARLRAMTWDR